MAKATSYEFSRRFWDYCFANPEKVKPNHIAVYFFAVEHCNRLGWKEKFGLPTEMVKDAVGIKSWHTYISAFNDLVDWGFFFLVERSKNQYSSNIIALIKNDEALDEALDKAITKHISKQLQSTYQSTYQSSDSIDKQIQTNTNNTVNNTVTAKYERPCYFLKQNEIEFEQLQMKSGVQDFEQCLEQWSLSVEGSNFAYSENKHEDYRKLTARFQKWINSWRTNKTEKDKPKPEKIPESVRLGKAKLVEVNGQMLVKPLNWEP